MLAYTSPTSAEIGTWIMVTILLFPATKVVVDWIKPPQIRPQPLGVKLHEEFATKEELEKLERDLNAQMKELRSYVHQEIHKVRDDLSDMSSRSDIAREGIHNRINAALEVLYEMRGGMNEIRQHQKS